MTTQLQAQGMTLNGSMVFKTVIKLVAQLDSKLTPTLVGKRSARTVLQLPPRQLQTDQRVKFSSSSLVILLPAQLFLQLFCHAKRSFYLEQGNA